MTTKDVLIQKISTKHNLPISKVKEIVEYQFKFASEVMKKGDFDTIRLPYFGKFSVNKNRVKHIQNGSTNRKR
jgi:nucleoid DNA-binding protein